MGELNPLYAYFQNKGAEWRSLSGSVEAHLSSRGRSGIASEFSRDPSYASIVCPYFRQLGELQLRSEVVRSLEGYVGAAFGLPLAGTMDILIGAIADACGYKTVGDQLLEIAPVLLMIGATVAAALGILRAVK